MQKRTFSKPSSSATSGAKVRVRGTDDLKTSCSCPDYSNPCKHIPAVYYLLWRGQERFLEALEPAYRQARRKGLATFLGEGGPQ